MCEFQESNCNGFGDMWWTDKCTYFSSIEQNLNSMFINPVNEAEVIGIIKLCKPKDSMDYDDISMWVLSRIAPQVVKPLVHIFNLSF